MLAFPILASTNPTGSVSTSTKLTKTPFSQTVCAFIALASAASVEAFSRRRFIQSFLVGCLIALSAGTPETVLGQEGSSKSNFDPAMFAQKNLVAWCIVPFDAKKRTPEQRAEMLDALGIKRLAYDYRAEHVPTFELEIETMKRHGIELTAWWFPGELNEEAKLILSLIKKHQIHPQLWVTGGGDPAMNESQTAAFINSEVARIRPIAEAAQDAGCKVALYNHGGWYGEPKNQIRLLKAIDRPNVGIVYNLHHAHDQIEQLAENLERMQPYLLALNLNGTQTRGDQIGKKILPIGEGDRDREVLRIIGQSGFKGPIGILNHTDLDAHGRLQENLSGLQQLTGQLAK
jgi:sugar phosphate isomerase/epimerase